MKDSSDSPLMHENPSNQVLFKKAASPLRLRKKSLQTDAGNEIWLITLSDLLMLLMIFFVLLFGMTLYQQKQTEASQAATAKPATLLPAAESQPAAQAASSDISAKEATATLESDLQRSLGDEEDLQGVTVRRRSQFIILTFPERIIFDPGQAQLELSVQPLLEKVAAFILCHPDLLVEVQGHTDDRPISNRRYPSNWELSADRATQVARALIRMGIHPAKISVRGYGEYQSLYPNDSDLHRLQNRRVEIQFSPILSNS
ncbi:MAG: flagellar motor protein MotB [Deltaproteobacteria bacterium]|nr:flagellar motor protein MotB [Deltaproteobacteria bacterium]